MRPKIWLAAGVVAAFFLLAGGAVAAGHYLITSVNQIKPSVRRELVGPVLRGERGAVGPPGDSGPQGPTGQTGPQGPTGGLIVNYTETQGNVVVNSGTSTAVCPAGDFVLGGGWTGLASNAVVTSSAPVGDNAWQVDASIPPAIGVGQTFQAVATCAS